MKELKDYIHLYIGCEVLITDEEFVKDLIEAGGNGRGALTGLHGEYGPEFAAYEGHHTAESPEYTWHLKLVLRRLDSMTKKDSIKIFGVDKHNFYEKTENDSPGDLLLFTPNEVVKLLNDSFDLFGLIDAGIAVEDNSQHETK